MTARVLFKNNVSQAKRLDVLWRKYVALSRNHCCTVNIKCHVNRSSGIGADGDGRTRPDEAKGRFSLLCENASKNRPTGVKNTSFQVSTSWLFTKLCYLSLFIYRVALKCTAVLREHIAFIFRVTELLLLLIT